MNERRWDALMAALMLPPSRNVFEQLRRAYGERHRAYHTARHIDDCLDKLDASRAIARQPAEVELALWFHDAVYKPYRHDNEARSAAWARAFLRRAGAEEDRLCRVGDMILATAAHDTDAGADVSLMMDIDLSVLGADPADFQAFERGVRYEYRRVPLFLYRRKRIELLAGFLARPRLYRTNCYYDRYESQARHNLGDALTALR